MPVVHSHRLLQPFRGLEHFVETEAADASSRDGVHWELYIRDASTTVFREAPADYQAVPLDLHYGRWSIHAGLQREPATGFLVDSRIDSLAAELVAMISANLKRLPFPRRDHFECWLMDEEQHPVALIQAASDMADSPTAPPLWRLGQQARESHCPDPGIDCRRLLELVNGNGRPGARTPCWIRRNADGSGVTVGDSGRHWDSAEFPEFLLRECWPVEADRLQVERYLRWLSPWLLSLDGLSAETRRRLEQQAWQRPMVVMEQFRSYPQVIDRDGLRAALVQARLRLAGGESGHRTLRDGAFYLLPDD